MGERIQKAATADQAWIKCLISTFIDQVFRHACLKMMCGNSSDCHKETQTNASMEGK